ncbi:MAG: hypothetical protein HY619_04630 [Thaumarchaeota archaeon]|nr:hypothetical protein [Nitrososphaerota archaeon]
MTGLRLQINRALEEKFREAAMRRFGFAKGALSRASEEAIQLWLSTTNIQPFEGDPVEAIDGLLADIDIDSVKMQHMATQIWRRRVAKHASH